MSDEAQAELKREITTLQARLTARAKSMLRARDVLAAIDTEKEDEGGRVYFGTTGQADMLHDLTEDLDGWHWDEIIGDAQKPDYIGDLARLRKEREASLDVAIQRLESERPGWPWTLSNYQTSSATCFLHAPNGGGVVHAEGKTLIDAINNALEKTGPEWMAAKEAEREAKDRAEFDRLKAKFEA